jgi:Leucine-rich repeat (LRR) protein
MNRGITLEDGTYGCRAVLHSNWSDDLFSYMTDNAVVELELNLAKGWKGQDLSFLARLQYLKSFEIFHFGIDSIEPLHFLHGLKRLGVTTYCSTRIDFSAFPELQSCGLEWRPKATSLFSCVTLRNLFINRYNGKDIAPFTNLVNLESLAILNAPVENLNGLNALTKLRSLRLANLKHLTSLTGIEGLASLEELAVQACRAVSSIKEVGSLSHLRKLHLNNDGSFESLKPLDSLSALESVVFDESTNIIDGDLSPLARQKKLSNVSFQNRRHYSHRREDFGAYRR